MSDKKMYTVRDLQDYFQCSHTTVYRILREGKAEVLRFGKRYRISEPEFLRLIEQRTEKLGDIEQTHDEA